MLYHNDIKFPFNLFYKIIDLTQENHTICYADDRDVVIRYSVTTSHIKNGTSICENNTMMILNLKKKIKVLLSVFLNTYLSTK